MEKFGPAALRYAPPLPARNPRRNLYYRPSPALPERSFQVDPELIPKPLFFRQMSTMSLSPPRALPSSSAAEFPPPLASPFVWSPASSPTSSVRTASSRSSASSRTSMSTLATAPSTPTWSPPSSPTPRIRPLAYTRATAPSPSPTPSSSLIPAQAPQIRPKNFLRRLTGPERELLKALKEKESDEKLQRLYDRQVAAYLMDGF